MSIPLDVITRKKLILVKQLYQRAVLQAEAQHSPVDRIMAVIGFDLAHETVLKAVAGALTSKSIATDFPNVLQQADALLLEKGMLEVPDKSKILYVRSIRNDAQHRAKYPGPTELSDSRTYSRDFLRQMIFDVWNEQFDSISLVDAIQNETIKGHLRDAERELAQGNYRESVLHSSAGLGSAIGHVRRSIIGTIPDRIRGIVIADGQKEFPSSEVLASYKQMQETLMRSVIGLNFGGYLKFNRITKATGTVVFFGDGKMQMGFFGYQPHVKETEFVLEFATDAVLQIESLVGDIEKPFTL
jgi:hypothetical protein